MCAAPSIALLAATSAAEPIPERAWPPDPDAAGMVAERAAGVAPAEREALLAELVVACAGCHLDATRERSQ